QLAVRQRDHRGVPAAVVHLAGLVPGVGGVVVDPGVGQALELDEAVVGPRDGGLLVVVGAAGGEHRAVRHLHERRTEQVAVVLLVLVAVGNDGEVAGRRVAVRVDTAVLRARDRPHRAGRARQAEQPALVVLGRVAELQGGGVLDAVHALEPVPIEDVAGGQHGHRHGGGLAFRRRVLRLLAVVAGRFHDGGGEGSGDGRVGSALFGW